MTQTDKAISILSRIDKNTKALLDAFASGVTADIIKYIKPSADKRLPPSGERVKSTPSKPAEISVSIDIKGVPATTKQPATPKGATRRVSVTTQPLPAADATPQQPTASPPAAIADIIPQRPPASPPATVPADIPARPGRPPVKKTIAATPVSKESKRDAKGRFEKGSGQSKGQKAFEDAKRKESSPGFGGGAAQDEKTKSFLSRLFGGVGDKFSQNTGVAKETAGLATLGPITGAVTEISSLGSSIKDTFSGLKDKLTGGGSKTGDKAADAQIEATGEVKKTLDATDVHEEERHKELISAIKKKAGATESPAAIKDAAAGQPKKRGILSRVAGAATGGAGGIMSGISGIFSGGMLKMILPLLLAGGAATAIFAAVKGLMDKKDGTDTGSASGGGGAIASVIKGAMELEASVTESLKNLIMGGGGESKTPPAPPADGQQSATEKKTYPPKEESTDERIRRIKSETDAYKNRYSEGLKQIESGGKGVVAPQVHDSFGWLASKHESGGDSGTVNQNDVGGAAYGKYQMHSSGTVGAFINNSKYKDDFAGLKPGTPEYGQKWKEVNARNPEEFAAAQLESVKKTHYAPMVDKAKELGFDVSGNKAMQETLFATAIQHGQTGGPKLLERALAGADPQTTTPDQFIQRIYGERASTDINGNLKYFTKDRSPGFQNAIKARIENERQDATAATWSAGNVFTPEPIKQTGQPTSEPTPMTSTVTGYEHPATSKPLGRLSPVANLFDNTAKVLSAFTPSESTQLAAPIQPPEPPHAPIVSPKPEPQPVTIEGGGAAGGLAGGQPAFVRPGPRNTPNQQPKKAESNIKMDFDDSILTLLIYDRI